MKRPVCIIEGQTSATRPIYFDEAMRLFAGRRTGEGKNDASAPRVSYWRALPTRRVREGSELREFAAPGSKPRVSDREDA